MLALGNLPVKSTVVLIRWPVVLIGSSMGGYLASLYAARHPEVLRVVLLAPAFGFARRWTETLDPSQLEEWKRTGWLSLYHFAEQRQSRVHYGLIADGLQYDRPNVPSFGDSRSGLSNDDFLSGIFQASDFPTPAPGVAGTLGRNTFRGPRYFNVDFALIRSISLPAFGRDGEVQLRLETFNLFNTTNLLPPQSNLTSAAFGRSTDALPGRIVQIGARISF